MNQLNTKPKTHVIITFDGLNIFITEEQNKALVGLSSDKFVKVNGIAVKGSSISTVLPIAEFYQQYPDKKPDHSRMPDRNHNEPDYKGISDEARAVAQRQPTHVLVQLRERLMIENDKDPALYASLELERFVIAELEARGYYDDNKQEYDLDELIEKGGIDGIIEKASKASNIEAMLRGFKRSIGTNPSQASLSLLSRMEHKLQLLKMQEQNEQSDWSEGLPDNN